MALAPHPSDFIAARVPRNFEIPDFILFRLTCTQLEAANV
jgi:hypothetical protein